MVPNESNSSKRRRTLGEMSSSSEDEVEVITPDPQIPEVLTMQPQVPPIRAEPLRAPIVSDENTLRRSTRERRPPEYLKDYVPQY